MSSKHSKKKAESARCNSAVRVLEKEIGMILITSEKSQFPVSTMIRVYNNIS